jgi:hypothetical protein
MNVTLFDKSVDVKLSPDGNIINKLDMSNIPSVVSINYNNVSAIDNFLNTIDGRYIVDLVNRNIVTLNLFPLDSVGITTNELYYLSSNKEFFLKKNVNFYQSWYNNELNFNLYFGSTIHSAMDYLISISNGYDFDETKKTKHFLTLNNLFRPNRKDLFDFYNKLTELDKNKFLCSFNFENIILEKNVFSDSSTSGSKMYGNNIIEFYKKCLVEIVAESSHISITEKSYKPIIVGVPFIYWGQSLSDFPQYEYFNQLGIDINYFNIDYTNIVNVKNKVTEILELPTTELLKKYKSSFDMALINKQKIINYIKSIENKIIRQ